MNKIKAITFDATGTLFKVRGSVGSNYEKIFTKYGIKLNSEKLNKNFLKIFSNLSKEYPSYGYAKLNNDGKFYYDKDGNEICGFKWWQHLMKSLVETSSTNLSKNQIENIPNEAYKELYDCFGTNRNSSKLITKANEHEFWEVYDEVIPTLDKLKENGIHLSVISNFDERLHTILKSLDLIKYFKLTDDQINRVEQLSTLEKQHYLFPNKRYDFITTSIESGYQKPSPQIFDFSYQKLLASLDDPSLKKDEIMYVGDSVGKDCVGSFQYGFVPCLINRSNETPSFDKYEKGKDLPLSDLKIINNLSQLLKKP
ncbi:hypothetical protein DICPUDRAFT_79010 [Dictyostelium purpureum]|uniref:Uncharacterized protein n=1 Tax=Dictyostelium purpureum TaxID=5786 RepID=F0ZLA2_DICPU|nr:uncharacterized protein DICPUDRAFT_79010 [Dictyostelium purpureum]EGC35265.1 hypothetical protein DICPUDRAFT_79010 [Dictyostelium purpureum]|eukprot:XP_003288191.1 hypothetical protein DICPUDRAFT_79010 [Dictyostelium purpureum]